MSVSTGAKVSRPRESYFDLSTQSFTEKIFGPAAAKKMTRTSCRGYLLVICVPRPKSASFSSESEFSGRGAAEA
jgi:hypothetical protein